jgi:hypothetical protein
MSFVSNNGGLSSLDEREEREKTLNPIFRLLGPDLSFVCEYNRLRGDGTNLFDLALKNESLFRASEQDLGQAKQIVTVDLTHLSALCMSEKVMKIFFASHFHASRSCVFQSIANGFSDEELLALATLADFTQDKKSKAMAATQLEMRGTSRSMEVTRLPPASGRARPSVQASSRAGPHLMRD